MSTVTPPSQLDGAREKGPAETGAGVATPEEKPLETKFEVFKPTTAFILAFSSLCLVTLAAAIDATSLSIALPIITVKLNGTAIEAFWSGTSFLLTSAVFQPVIAGLSHVFGRKQLTLTNAVIFAVGSIIAAVAKNFTYLLVGRSIQGIGAGGILVLGEILITDLVPLHARGSWFGYMGSMWAIGSVGGPLMGGAFAQNVTWRWIFWINLPIIGLGGTAMLFFLRLKPTEGKMSVKLSRFDWLGSIFFVASAVSFLIPITWGGVMYEWSSWHTLVPLLLGLAGLSGFAFYEKRLSDRCYDEHGLVLPGNAVEPIIRFSLFENWTQRILWLHTFLHGIILWSLLYFLPLYYEAVKGYTPIIAGVAILPETGFVAPCSIIVGVTIGIYGRWRWADWTGWTLATFGCGLLILLHPKTTIAQWVFLNIPVASGTGVLFPAMGLGAQSASRPQDAGHAAAMYAFIRVIGQSLGVAIGGVVFQNQLKIKLLQYPDLAAVADAYSRDSTELVQIIKAMPASVLKNNLIQAYADALSVIWMVMCGLAGIGLVTSFFLKEYSMQMEHATKQGFQERVSVADAEAPVLLAPPASHPSSLSTRRPNSGLPNKDES